MSLLGIIPNPRQFGNPLRVVRGYKLRSVGLSRPSAVSLRSAVPLRRMDYASHLTFVITRTLLPCFISAASPQGALMGVWGLRPQLKKTLRSLCSLRLTKPAVDLNWGCEMRSCGAGMRPRRRRRVGRGRSPSREAAARARARTPTIGVLNTKNTEESKGNQNA